MLTCVCIFSSSFETYFVCFIVHVPDTHTQPVRGVRTARMKPGRPASGLQAVGGAASPWARPCRAWLLTGAAPAAGGPAARGSAPAPLAIGEPRACQVSVSLSHVAKVNRRKPAQTKVPDF